MVGEEHITQDRLFWNSKWTKDMESYFVHVLADQAIDGNYEIGTPSRAAIRDAVRRINYRHTQKVDYRYRVTRLQRLRQRYLCFKWLTTQSGFYYDETSATYEFPTELYNVCVREFKLVRAYRVAPELLWRDLQVIYGQSDGISPPGSPMHTNDMVNSIVVGLEAPPLGLNGLPQESNNFVNWNDADEEVAQNFWGYVANGLNDGIAPNNGDDPGQH